MNPRKVVQGVEIWGQIRVTVVTSSGKGLVGSTDKGGCRRDQVPSLNILGEYSKTG